MDRLILRTYALSFLGKNYLFGTAPGGGDDPIYGFDCSGFVCEILRAAGVVPWNFRTTAQGLYYRMSTQPDFPDLGDLAFFGESRAKISHVAFCLDSTTMVEAGGGDETTTTLDVAAKKNAFVRIRPIKYRKDFICFARPPY